MLAKRIQTAGIHASYDEACKRLLANKQILSWVLQTCVEEFSDCSIQDIEEKYIIDTPEIARVSVHQDELGDFVEGIGTEDTTMTEGTVFFDIRFHAAIPADDEVISLIINLEAQNDYYPGYPLVKRGIYYGSRLISAQYGTEFTKSHFEKIKKVYSIWICLNPPKQRRNTITHYSIKEQSMIGNVKEKKENYDLLTVAMVCLGDSEDENYKGLLKMLDVLLANKKEPEEKKKILQNEFHITMTETMEREVLGMCNLSKGIYESGWNEAWGEAWGEAWEKARLEDIRNLMETLDISAEKSMDILKIPNEERGLYKKALKDEAVLQP